MVQRTVRPNEVYCRKEIVEIVVQPGLKPAGDSRQIHWMGDTIIIVEKVEQKRIHRITEQSPIVVSRYFF